jgi:lysophospholipase L1-like esterase
MDHIECHAGAEEIFWIMGLKIAFIGDSLTEGVVGASYFDMLQDKLPQHRLFNYGKGGDTVISLYRRLHKIDLVSPLDLGFLWIGANDIFVKTTWFSPIKKQLRRQPWAKSHTQFQDRYQALLDFLQDKITHIYTVPPLLIGEDTDNPWNKELTILSKIIQDLSDSYPNVEFVDLRVPFISLLALKTTSPYVPKDFFRLIWDAIFGNVPENWEKKASEKGLHFTMDGVHLNRAGAERVAEIFLEKIQSKTPLVAGDT